MASRERSILNRIVTVLRAVDGTGSYNYDLSDTVDRVTIGAPPVGGPDLTPSVFLSAIEFTDSHAASLGKHEQNLTVSFFGFTSSSDSAGERMLTATELLTDIRRALYADRTLNSNALDLLVEGGSYDGESALNMQTFGVCAGRISVRYRDGVD